MCPSFVVNISHGISLKVQFVIETTETTWKGSIVKFGQKRESPK